MERMSAQFEFSVAMRSNLTIILINHTSSNDYTQQPLAIFMKITSVVLILSSILSGSELL